MRCSTKFGTFWWSASVRDALSWSLGDTDLAGEATDEAFARALELWGRVADMTNPAGWAFRVGQN